MTLRQPQLERLMLPQAVYQRLTLRDEKLLHHLIQEEKQRRRPDRVQELERMRQGKVELQALFSLGHDHLSRTFLPACILRRDYI